VLLEAREQVPTAEAVADGARTDSHRVDRDLEERVEGDDLVHLAAPDRHVVGKRVGELGRQRAHLAADAAEIVEQARPGGRELSEEGRQPEDVHAAIVLLLRLSKKLVHNARLRTRVH
jgi:hypothetical protein